MYLYNSFCVIKLYSFYFWFLDSYVIYLWMKFDFKDYYVLIGNGNNYCFYFLLMFLGEFFLVFICLLFVKGVLFVFLGVIFILKLFRFCFFILIGDLFFGWYIFVVFFMVNYIGKLIECNVKVCLFCEWRNCYFRWRFSNDY